MDILDTTVDPRDQYYLDFRAAALASLAELETALDAARDGGGERAATRHHARGKLLARERVELLVDRDAPLLELSPVAGWGTGTPVGAGVVTAIGVVEDLACVIVASDPTVRGGAVDGATLRKIRRAQQIAHENRLPLLSLLEADGTVAPGEPPRPEEHAEVFRHTGEVMAGYTRLAEARIPVTGTFFGESPLPGGADPTAVFDQVVAVRARTAGDRVAAAGGPVDHHAEDDRDALRLTRRCVRRLCPGAAGPGPAPVPAPPLHDPEDLLAIPVTDPREILGRILDGSQLDEDRPEHAPALCAAWGRLHGYRVGVLADTGEPAGPGEPNRSGEADKAVRFVRRAEATGTPLVLLRHGVALPAPAENALAGAAVPLATVRLGGWHGLSAVAARARFRFAWPGSHATPPASPAYPASPAAPAPPDSPAPPAAGDGRTVAGGRAAPAPETLSALALSGRQDDDGVIDPRDTRTVLGFCLSIVSGRPR